MRRHAAFLSIGPMIALLAACGDPAGGAVPPGSTVPTVPVSSAPASTVPGPTEPGSTVPDPTVPDATVPDSTAPRTPPTSAPDADALAGVRAARERWQATGVHAYEWTYEVACFCAPTGPTTARVLGGRTLRAPADEWRVNSVDEVLDRIESEILGGGDIVVTYDDLGVPVSVDADPLPTAIDDEYVRIRTSFTPVADPLARWFTEALPCGFSLQAVTADQTAMLYVAVSSDGPLDPPDTPLVELPLGRLQLAVVRFGTDLASNWCDDVSEPGEPEATIAAEWPLTGGTLDLTAGDLQGTGVLSGLVATTPDGEAVTLGDTTIVNTNWGVYAG